MNSTPSVTRLCIADDATFWPWHRWPEFHRWPDRESTLVVVPLAGSADWGLGHPLDAEETVLMSVLREASLQRPAHLKLLVLPPVRFVLGPDAGSAFAVDPPLAHGLLAELLASVAASGFRKVVLYNSSPWNEEFIASVARDNRIALGLQDKLYLGNLSAKRDWGHAREYVRGMWLMLQQDEPDDFVLATGETTPVRTFVEWAFADVGITLRWEGTGVDEKGYCAETGKCLIEVDPRYFRPTEVDLLIGDPTKAKTKPRPANRNRARG
jgi:creatinine amidohydrolase/Fe(II)-dependent formamide hydrolase-like protein